MCIFMGENMGIKHLKKSFNNPFLDLLLNNKWLGQKSLVREREKERHKYPFIASLALFRRL